MTVDIATFLEKLKQADVTILEDFIYFHPNDISEKIKKELQKVDDKTCEKIIQFLTEQYQAINQNRLKFSEKQKLIAKNQIIYYLARLPYYKTSDLFPTIYEQEPDLRIKRSAALSGTLVNCYTPEADYLKKMTPGSMEDIVNRSATLVYNEDVAADFFEYIDDNIVDWYGSRLVRLNRLKETDERALAFRLFDLQSLYCFFESRKWKDKLLKEELDTIKKCTFPVSEPKDRQMLFHQIKTQLETTFEEHFTKQKTQNERQTDKNVLKAVEYVQERIGEEPGQDYYRIIRIMDLARDILETEAYADPQVVLLSILLHDIDKPTTGKKEIDYQDTIQFLKSLNLNQEEIDKILYIIMNVANKRNRKYLPNLDINGKIVQDAYRLDNMGAIAIARAISNGTKQGRHLCDALQVISDEQKKSNQKGTIIGQVYESVLSKNEMLNTEKAREIAEIRHKAEQDYVKQFFSEWKGINYHERERRNQER